ncbi:MAG: hypothetical protein HWD92_04390 [Flavobacteriia bacterium]|nr:hypothetical protein [Flavobacteriia bacterium]
MKRLILFLLLAGLAIMGYQVYHSYHYVQVAKSLDSVSTDIGRTFWLTQRSANDKGMSWHFCIYPSSSDSTHQCLTIGTPLNGEYFYMEKGSEGYERKPLVEDSFLPEVDYETVIQLLNYFVNHRDLNSVNTSYPCFTLWEFHDFKLKELKGNNECASVNWATGDTVWGNFVW